MIDLTRGSATRVRVTPADPSLPLGLCEPQLDGDVGWDLVAAADTPIAPMGAADVPVNVRLALPPDHYVDIRNRSSMSTRGLYVDQNLIDNGYRGMLYVFVRNLCLPAMRAFPDEQVAQAAHGGLIVPGEEGPYAGPNVAAAPPSLDPGTVVLRAGERIAQLVFHRASRVWIDPVLDFEDATERGDRGFGSTGI